MESTTLHLLLPTLQPTAGASQLFPYLFQRSPSPVKLYSQTWRTPTTPLCHHKSYESSLAKRGPSRRPRIAPHAGRPKPGTTRGCAPMSHTHRSVPAARVLLFTYSIKVGTEASVPGKKLRDVEAHASPSPIAQSNDKILKK